MNQYFNAAQGLKKMFISQVGAIICTVGVAIGAIGAVAFAAAGSLSLIALFGGLAGIAGIGAIVFAIISLVGLYGAGKDIGGCKTAFTITIISLCVSVLGSLFKSSAALAMLFALAGYVLSFLQTYYVCTSVSEVMSSIGAQDVANQGAVVWKIYLACNILLAVMKILEKITVLALLTSVANLVVSLVGLIMYMIFLNKSYKALGA